ncbi:MAG: D-alanyl-D-alanine carboxypeptidase family protein [Candidatus Azotimanducaceae bacterium]|uniref:Peptidase M15 n=1 Tax=OM182 bacterium TaxID=2510334 RepID=A0A520S525_9GAMM|nr:peptidase M15 [Gammaproteobacteria bacterium]OUV67572.1 MAG: hypothetical protein CBC93_04690 [Gammaproteobacteria bacterium TMED133]RZO77544.1 MAG: peptidase M15 [OM182 bacterium]
MKRRDLLKIFSASSVAAIGGHMTVQSHIPKSLPMVLANTYEDIDTTALELAQSIQHMSTAAPDKVAFLRAFEQQTKPILADSNHLKKYLQKMENFENSHHEDVYLTPNQNALLGSVFRRMDRVQNVVGHGNFNVLGFDHALKLGKRYSSVGEFPNVEKEFLEELFAKNPRGYGFYGDKVITNLTFKIAEKEVKKIPRTGHFLYRGEAEALYSQVKKDLGDKVFLTSGIRSVVKQTHLFLAKTIQSKGNLSRASRSLAPPGHSYHGIGDFDVGKVGFGAKNFTEDFASTDEFKKLVDLGYVDMRYPKHNLLGVRYEPWHIKVVT